MAAEEGRRQERVDNSVSRLLLQQEIISSEDNFYKGSTNTYYKIKEKYIN